MTYVCSNCLFCEAVEDEDYSSCELRQALIMPYDKVCDFFELNRKSFKEIDKVTMDLNGVNEYTNDLQDEYTNTTELPKVKITEQNGDDILEYCENCQDAYHKCEECEDDLGFDMVLDDTQKPEPPKENRIDLITRLYGTYGEEYTPEEKRRVAEYRARQLKEHYTPAENECNCDECCNANSYPTNDFDIERDLQLEDLTEATDALIEDLAFLGDGISPRDVVKSILSLEATLSLLKRYLIEYEDEYLAR